MSIQETKSLPVEDEALAVLSSTDFIKPTGALYAIAMLSPEQKQYHVDEYGAYIVRSEEDPATYICAISWKEATLSALLGEAKDKSLPDFHEHRVVHLNVRGTEHKGVTNLYFVILCSEETTRLEAWWLPDDHKLGDREDFTFHSGVYRVNGKIPPENFDVYVDELGC